MTSNVGSAWLQDDGLNEEEKRSRTAEALRATFKPEFLNRVDDIITFRSLTPADIERIVDIQIGLIQKRLAERKLTLELTGRAKDYIARSSYSPIYGARPLKRALQKMVLDPLALKLLAGDFTEGDKITIDLDSGEELQFLKKESKKRRTT